MELVGRHETRGEDMKQAVSSSSTLCSCCVVIARPPMMWGDDVIASFGTTWDDVKELR